MCNLYNIKTNHQAIRDLARFARESINLEPELEVYPDRPAPVVRNGENGRELVNLTWGMPTPASVLKGKPDSGVTNIRNVASPHWRRWLGVESRCVVPWTEFCEWEDTRPKKTKRWFSINEDKPLAFFAGIWTGWSGTRGSMKNPREGDHQLFGFLTCGPNAVVKPIHPKAMPVILTTQNEIDAWLTEPWETAKALQRPLPANDLILLPVEAEKGSLL